MKAIVNFRTVQFGAFKFTKGLRRGYWRVLVVKDENGPLKINSNNVISLLFSGSDGLDGVTEKSKYYIGGDYDRACDLAEGFNSKI